jgi:hypothetical protein
VKDKIIENMNGATLIPRFVLVVFQQGCIIEKLEIIGKQGREIEGRLKGYLGENAVRG